MGDFIVDASVVAKWLLPEEDSDRARALIAPAHFLRAPDLLVSELGNIFWKRCARRELTAEEAQEIVTVLLRRHIDSTVRLLPSRILLEQAMRIAAAEQQTIYDCLYLAYAVQARCRFVTADEKFVRSINDPLLKRHIVSLRDPSLDLPE